MTKVPQSPIHFIRSRFRHFHPDHYLIAKGMLLVSFFVFLGKIAAALKEMVVASRYGVSGTVDAYLFIFNLVYWPVSLWFSVLSVVLIPLAATIKKNSPAELPNFRSELLGMTLLIGIGLLVLFGTILSIGVKTGCTGLSTTTVLMAIHMVPRLSMVLVLGMLVSLFSAWTLAAGRQVNTLLEGVPAMVILMALIFFPGWGPEPLIWGTVVGFLLQLLCLGISLAWRGEIEVPRFGLRSPQWREFSRGFGIMLGGQAVMSFIAIIDQFFASHSGPGAVAYLGYANRVLFLLLSLGALAVFRATLPVFSKTRAQEGQSYDIAIHWVRILFILGLISLLISWWLAPWIMKLLFEHGAFTAQNTQVATEIFRYGLPQLPFYFACLVLVSLLASHKKYNLIALMSVINLVVKVIANFSFVPWMGLKGLLAATCVMYTVSLGVLYYFVTVFVREKKGAAE